MSETKLAGVAAAIFTALRPILNADDTAAEARDLATQARDGAMGAREAMLITVAKISADAQLTKGDVDRVATLVANQNNDKDRKKTIATLCAEIKNAAHPSVRNHVPSLVSEINDAWAIEQEAFKADKSAPRPLAALFKRRYHVMTGVFKQVAMGNLLLTGDAIVAYARANDPNLDAEKIHKRLASLIGQLQDFHHDFAHEDIGLAIDVLTKITAPELAKVRREVIVAEPIQPETKPDTTVGIAETPGETPAETKSTNTVVDTSMGAIDIDDLLDGQMGLRQAA